jgi:hypothetical protein
MMVAVLVVAFNLALAAYYTHKWLRDPLIHRTYLFMYLFGAFALTCSFVVAVRYPGTTIALFMGLGSMFIMFYGFVKLIRARVRASRGS